MNLTRYALFLAIFLNCGAVESAIRGSLAEFVEAFEGQSFDLAQRQVEQDLRKIDRDVAQDPYVPVFSVSPFAREDIFSVGGAQSLVDNALLQGQMEWQLDYGFRVDGQVNFGQTRFSQEGEWQERRGLRSV